MATTKKTVTASTEAVKTVAKEVETAKKATTKAAETKATAKKASPSKRGRKPGQKAVAVKTFVQFKAQDVETEKLIAAAKKDWAKKYKKKTVDLVSINLYIKPEDKKAYYVINDNDLGDVPFTNGED